ncbi:MAG: TetR/AcrR family transcriptional regulator [Spirochaetia bacterium]|nr:TetR/AcrR family transcriptional regulator [Spirochaetia bacterium]
MSNKSKEILECAIKLFSNKGYHATSMRNIAKEAGIVQSSIYNHYKNKETILIEIANLLKSEIEETFNYEINAENETKIEIYKNKILKSIKEKPEFWRLVHSMRMNNDIMKIIKREIDDLQKMIIKNITNLISIEKKPINQEQVFLFWAAIDGIVSSYLLIENYPIEKILTKLFKSIEKRK